MLRVFLRLLVIAICGVLVIQFSCTDSFDKSPVVSIPVGTDIPAVTSEAGGIAITGGTVRRGWAQIGFLYTEDPRTVDIWIEAGLSDSTSFLRECLNKEPNSFMPGVTNVYTIEGLQPSTVYHVRIIREKGVEKYKVAAQFTTVSAGE